MTRPGAYPLAWGGLLGASAGLLWAWTFGLPHASSACRSATCVAEPYLAPALLSAAAIGSIVTGLLLIATRTRGIDRRTRAVCDQSMTTVVLAAGIGLVALCGAVGLWLAPIGVAVVALGVAGLVREARALRELRSEEHG